MKGTERRTTGDQALGRATLAPRLDHEDVLERFPDAQAVAELPLALKVRLRGGHTEWVPKSAIHQTSEVEGLGDRGRLVLKGWFARRRQLLPEQDARGSTARVVRIPSETTEAVCPRLRSA